ncbi:MAG: hypothetical protein AB1521_10600 [Bacteroidota bacterium]
MKRIIFLVGVVAVALGSTGCYSMYETQFARDELPPDSSAMSIDEVITLSNEGVSDELIISQIKATYSYFGLTTDDIVYLKKAGVSEKVINAMIKTAEPTTRKIRRYYYGSSYYGYPYSYYYGYPWYSSFYFGYYGGHYRNYPSVSHFPSYGGHYNRGYFGGHGYRGNYSGSNGFRGFSGGHRSAGRHR